jgi:hypothetical protein
MTKVLGVPVVWLTLALGVWSQFFYVAGQEVLSTALQKFVVSQHSGSSLDAFDILTVGHSVFAVGRFLAAFAQWFLKPRWILMVSYIGMIVFSVLCMKTTGSAAIVMAMLVYLFESGAYSIIFAISLRGTARHTKTAATFLTVAVSGGAYFPFAQYAAYLARGESYSFCVLVALFCAGAIFPFYLNFVPAAKKQVDPVPNEYLRGYRCRSRNQQNDTPGENHNPVMTDVFSRRRSVLENPLQSVSLPDLAPPRAQSQNIQSSHLSLNSGSKRHSNLSSISESNSRFDTARHGS